MRALAFIVDVVALFARGTAGLVTASFRAVGDFGAVCDHSFLT